MENLLLRDLFIPCVSVGALIVLCSYSAASFKKWHLVLLLPPVVFPTLCNETGWLRSPVFQSTNLLVTADLSANVLLPVASPKLCSCYCNFLQERGKVSKFCLILCAVCSCAEVSCSVSHVFFHEQGDRVVTLWQPGVGTRSFKLCWSDQRMSHVICGLSVRLRRLKTSSVTPWHRSRLRNGPSQMGSSLFVLLCAWGLIKAILVKDLLYQYLYTGFFCLHTFGCKLPQMWN